MPSPVKNYDPAEVTMIIGGHIISGYADGTFLSIARNNDAFTRVAGADGEGTRAKSNDRSGTFTFTLMQSSQSNDILSGFASADDINNGGTFPVLIKDGNGTSRYAGEICWVQKVADSAFGKEAESREWIVETNELVPFVGGIPAVS